MSDELNVTIETDSEDINNLLDKALLKLSKLQLQLKEKKLPVIILLEGYGTAGKGTTIKKIIKGLDPRFFDVVSTVKRNKDEKRLPFIQRYFTQIPEAGSILILDSGWMSELTQKYLTDNINTNDYLDTIDDIKRFERTLADNGYLVLKYFLDVSKTEQKKRIEELLDNKNTKWRVSDFDEWENKHYSECKKIYDEYMDLTNTTLCPWTVIDSTTKKECQLAIINDIISRIDTALTAAPVQSDILNEIYPLKPIAALKDIPLDYEVTGEEYKTQYEELQHELEELHNKLYRKKIPVVIMYEGWDAAGKGGNIKRVTSGLDPRGYEVFPIASPTPAEKNRHYLWRFYNKLPKKGHISVFDRSWYGRVMVERIEGFCSEAEWKRAYNEINEFEAYLTKCGVVVIKFWLQIDKDTQLERFNLRKNTPEKRWKITEEDWRNREKWDAYEKAIDEMFAKTNTDYAPWHILESNNKMYARLKAMRIVIDQINKALEQD